MTPREIEARACRVAQMLNYDESLTSQQMDADTLIAAIKDVFGQPGRVAPVCGLEVLYFGDRFRCGLAPTHKGVCWPLLPLETPR